MRIKLINLNMWFGGYKTWDAIISYLQEERPDIIMLQEVQDSSDPEAPIHLRSYQSLREALGYPYSEYEASMILQKESETAPFGNAIFSKFPLTGKSILWLQGNKAEFADGNQRQLIPTFPRNLLHCQCAIGSKTYNLMSLQGVWAVDGNETPAQRQMAQKISNYIGGKENIILAGDFNVNENTGSIRLIEDKLSNIFKDERKSSFNMRQKTAPGFATAVVDFVFTSPSIKVISHSTAPANVSDHQSQIVMFDL